MAADFRAQLQANLQATFSLERELGGGGMSRVFLATENALDRRVVIKTVPGDMLSAAAAERFRREILTAARLSHPNIVPVLAAGDAGGVPWFSMPWVEGASLREQLQRGPMPLGAAVAVLRDVARALADAHAHGIAHRDIKPENILLARGAAVVTDFGVAKALSEATQNGDLADGLTGVGMAIGTPAYMAPEQIAADPRLDHRADLYAWGLVAYETLSGQRAFEGISGSALIAAQIGTMPPSLSSVAPSVPAALSTVVMQCLAKNPADRPPRADDVVAVMESLSGSQVAANGMLDATPTARAGSNARGRLFGGIAAAVVVVAIAAFMWRGSSAGAVVDQRAIAIAPFRVGGAAPSVKYVREGLADLMVPQIQSVPGTRVLGVRLVLDRWRRAAGSADTDLDDAGALRVAKDAGAGQLIIGDAVGSAERLTITARLLDVANGNQIARSQVTGPADSLVSSAARLTTELLALRDGATRDRVRTVLTMRPEALTAYLTGEGEYRRGRYAAAAKAFADAYATDTTFALAALRVSSSNGWTSTNPIPGDWIDRAWRHRDRLTGADSLLLSATTGSTYPVPMARHDRFRELGELATRANSAEIWFQYGDQLVHYGGAAAEPNVVERSLKAFQQAEAIDSSFAPALEHQWAVYQALKDSAAAMAALQRQARVDSTGDFYRVTALLAAASTGRPVPEAMLDAFPHSQLSAMAIWVSGADAEFLFFPDIALADSLSARARRAGAVVPSFERQLAWSAGRPSRAAKLREERSTPESMSDEVLAGLMWEGDAAIAQRSATGLAEWLRAHPSDSLTPDRASALYYGGLWAFNRGDTATVMRARQSLAALKPPTVMPWLRNLSSAYEQMLGAYLAVARKSSDTRARLAQLDSIVIDAPGIAGTVRTTLSSQLADLWERIDDPSRALAAGRRFERAMDWGRLSSTRVRREARLLERLGRPHEAIDAWRMYVALRANAEPSLQPDLAQAKANLARLEAKVR
ncbi:serine/threonine-protein kinase [Gemmatimonas sp.]|uniref:serine/threonine-protein kinase n=1 Tax=Gemmatimonas sp. TaxID=1962908 RepID=UPI0039831815